MFRPHWVCPLTGVCAFPVYTAQAPGCSIWSRPCAECGSSFWVLHKSADSVAPAFCVFPGLSSLGSQGLGRPLPGRGAPFPSAAPVHAGGVPATCVCSQKLASSRDPPSGGCPVLGFFNGHASNVMLKILQARLQQYVNHELPGVQPGFRKGR